MFAEDAPNSLNAQQRAKDWVSQDLHTPTASYQKLLFLGQQDYLFLTERRLLAVTESFLFSSMWPAASRVPSGSASQMGRSIGKVLWSKCFIVSPDNLNSTAFCLSQLWNMTQDPCAFRCNSAMPCFTWCKGFMSPWPSLLSTSWCASGIKTGKPHVGGQGGTKHDNTQTCTQTHSQAFEVNGNVSHLFSLLQLF